MTEFRPLAQALSPWCSVSIVWHFVNNSSLGPVEICWDARNRVPQNRCFTLYLKPTCCPLSSISCQNLKMTSYIWWVLLGAHGLYPVVLVNVELLPLDCLGCHLLLKSQGAKNPRVCLDSQKEEKHFLMWPLLAFILHQVSIHPFSEEIFSFEWYASHLDLEQRVYFPAVKAKYFVCWWDLKP